MVSTLAVKIHDGRFLQLINRMLQAGYLEDWRWNATLSGAPQGGIASPVLSNIYLDRFDQFVEQQLIPEYTRGEKRRSEPRYRRVESRIAKAKRHGDRDAVRALRRLRRRLPSQDPGDCGYRRLRYVRYCDLCRYRHKSHYADLQIMPMSALNALVVAVPPGHEVGIIVDSPGRSAGGRGRWRPPCGTSQG